MSTIDRALPETTLLVLLGASEYPNWPSLEANQRFANSAEAVVEYFLDKYSGFKLPYKNLLNLFDSEKAPNEQSLAIGTFIKERSKGLEAKQQKVADLIIYFIGHGGFEGVSDYYLTLKTSDEASPGISSLRARDIAKRLERDAHKIRCTLILDSCFSGAAPYSFMSSTLQNMTKQLDVSLRAIPSRGITLLCSSSKDDPSIAPNKDMLTLFSGSLLRNLREGLEGRQEYMTLRELHSLICGDIRANFPEYGVLPEIHSPNQRQGDIASEIDLFPNPGFVKVESPANDIREQVVTAADTSVFEVESKVPVVPSEAEESQVQEPEELSGQKPVEEGVEPEELSGQKPADEGAEPPVVASDKEAGPPSEAEGVEPAPKTQSSTVKPDPTSMANVLEMIVVVAFWALVIMAISNEGVQQFCKSKVSECVDFVDGFFHKKPESIYPYPQTGLGGYQNPLGGSGLSGTGGLSGASGFSSTKTLRERLKESLKDQGTTGGTGSPYLFPKRSLKDQMMDGLNLEPSSTTTGSSP